MRILRTVIHSKSATAVLCALLVAACSASSLGRAQQPINRQGSDSFVSNGRSPFHTGSSVSDPAAAAEPLGSHGPAAAAAAAAAALAAPAGFAQQGRGAGLLQQQLGTQQEQAAAMLAWQQQLPVHAQDGNTHPQQQLLYSMPHHKEGAHRQPLPEPNLARLSEPGVQWLQQQQLPQHMFMSTPGAAAGSLPEQLANPLVTQQQQQQLPLERRSAPLEIPWHTSMVGQPPAAGSSGRGGGMGTAMYARLTAQHQLGQLGGPPSFSGASLPDALGAGPGAPLLAGSLPADGIAGFHQLPQGPMSVQDGSLDPGQLVYATPRAPKALRERGLNRERRRSERRLSKGANIAWSTCQIINASELRMLECIGGGAYGQVGVGWGARTGLAPGG